MVPRTFVVSRYSLIVALFVIVALAGVAMLTVSSAPATAQTIDSQPAPTKDSEPPSRAGSGFATLAFVDYGPMRTVPVTPCRIVDTRVAGGIMAAGSTRNWYVTDPILGSQGQNPAGCGIPYLTAMGAVVTVTAVSPTGTGFLRVWPYGDTEPNATLLNYSTALNASNTATIPMCNSGFECVTAELSVKNYSANTHVVIDVIGYLEPARWAVVEANGTVARGSLVDTTNTGKVGTGQYEVYFDRDVSGCAIIATAGDTTSLVPAEATAGVAYRLLTPEAIWVETWDMAGTNIDHDFHVSVEC